MGEPARKMCKHHLEKEAVIRSDGISTGLCADCLTVRGKKGGRRKKADR